MIFALRVHAVQVPFNTVKPEQLYVAVNINKSTLTCYLQNKSASKSILLGNKYTFRDVLVVN